MPSTSKPFSLRSAPKPLFPPDACLAAGNRLATKFGRFWRELNSLHPLNPGGFSAGLIRLTQGRKNLLQVARDILHRRSPKTCEKISFPEPTGNVGSGDEIVKIKGHSPTACALMVTSDTAVHAVCQGGNILAPNSLKFPERLICEKLTGN